jgi:hypothetical protein
MIEERNPWRGLFHRGYGLDSFILPEGKEVSMLGEDEGSEEVAVHCHLRQFLKVPTNAISGRQPPNLFVRRWLWASQWPVHVWRERGLVLELGGVADVVVDASLSASCLDVDIYLRGGMRAAGNSRVHLSHQYSTVNSGSAANAIWPGHPWNLSVSTSNFSFTIIPLNIRTKQTI